MQFSKRQIEIIDAATGLICEKGIQNLTTKNLAAEMNFSEPALYRHFKDKTDILKSVLVHYTSQMKSSVEKIITENSLGAEKVEKLMSFQFTHFANNPSVVMTIFSEASFQYNDTLSNAVLGILNQKKLLLEEIILIGQKDQSIRLDFNPSQLADIIMGSMRFTILRWRLNEFNFNLTQEGNELWLTIEKILKCPQKK